MSDIIGVLILLFIILVIVNLVVLITSKIWESLFHKKAKAKKLQHHIAIELRKSAIKHRPLRVRYKEPSFEPSNVDSLRNGIYVYLVHNVTSNATKIGVGQFGRVHQIITSNSSASPDGEHAGWYLLKLALFDERGRSHEEKANAFAAEARVLRYWRKHLKLKPFLSEDQMGFSEIVIDNGITWRNIHGASETVQADQICELTTWEIVRRSAGYQDIDAPIDYLRQFISRPEFRPDEESLNQLLTIRKTNEAFKNRKERVGYLSPLLTPEERFWKHVDRKKIRQCWPWLGSVSSAGYAKYTWQGKSVFAHRLIKELILKDAIDKRPYVNRCGKRSCVNPTHWGPKSK